MKDIMLNQKPLSTEEFLNRMTQSSPVPQAQNTQQSPSLKPISADEFSSRYASQQVVAPQVQVDQAPSIDTPRDFRIPTWEATGREGMVEGAFKTAVNVIPSALNFGIDAVRETVKIPKSIYDIATKEIPGLVQEAGGAKQAARMFMQELPGTGAEVAKGIIPAVGQGIDTGIEGARKSIIENPFGNIAPFIFGAKQGARTVDQATQARAQAAMGDYVRNIDQNVGKPIPRGTGTNLEQAFETGMSKTSGMVTRPVEKMAQTVGEGVSQSTRFGVSRATGLQPDTVTQIQKSPESFTKENMAKIDRAGLADEVKSRLDKRIEDMSDTGAGYAEIRRTGAPVAVDRNWLDDTIRETTGIDIKKGQLSTTGSASVRESRDVRALQNLYDLWKPVFSKGQMTADELLNFRSDLAGMAKFDREISKSSALENLSGVMRGKFNTEYRNKVKGLEELDANFSSMSNELKTLRKGIIDSQGNLTDSNRIANATGKGKDKLLSRLEEISPGISEKIKTMKAIEDIQNASGIKVGTYDRAALLGGSFIFGGPLPAIITTILTSPTVAVPLLRRYGLLKNAKAVNAVVQALKDSAGKVNAIPSTLDRDVRDVKVRAGLSIEDVSKSVQSGNRYKMVGGKFDGKNVTVVDITPNGSVRLELPNGDTFQTPMERVLESKKLGDLPGGNFSKQGNRNNPQAPMNTEADFNAMRAKIAQMKDPAQTTLGKKSSPVVGETTGSLETQARNYKTVEEFVKAQGTPVYHGTDAKFNEFSLKDFGKTDEGFLGRGVYMTADKANAKQYGKNIVESFVDLKNPYVYDDAYLFGGFNPAKIARDLGLPENATSKQITDKLKSMGHDGVIVNEITDVGVIPKAEVVVFNPSQIKTRSQLTDIWKKANAKSNFGRSTITEAQVIDFIKKWTRYDNMINRNGANLSTFDRLKNEITPELEKELSKYKPKEPLTLYRFQEKGRKTPELSSWSKDQTWVEDMAEFPGRNYEVLKRTFSPDEILVDIERIPSKTELTDIGEVIVKTPRTMLGQSTVYEGPKELTLKTLDKLKGRSTVSKQFISDLTNAGDIKQAERDVIRKILAEEGNNVNVSEFIGKVESQLLPLKRSGGSGYVEAKAEREKLFDRQEASGLNIEDYLKKNPAEKTKLEELNKTMRDENPGAFGGESYENIVLPDDLRGPVASYSEHIYQSPIKTSAGNVHFSKEDAGGYFAHTRVEDMSGSANPKAKKMLSGPNQGIRRVIEIQSDLFQKGRLESETGQFGVLKGDESRASIGEVELAKRMKIRDAEIAKLEPYRNTWYERIIREEIKQAAKDGKTKLQFPTGETAMKIEGLGEQNNFAMTWFHSRPPDGAATRTGGLEAYKLKSEELKIGMQIERADARKWIITDILGDGKFKAVPKNIYDKLARKELAGNDPYAETFDISGKVDTENPIYKFYEKDVQKFLNKLGGKKVVDDRGVEWVELDLSKEDPKKPVQAFGKAQVKTVLGGAAATGAGLYAFGARDTSEK